MTAASEKTRDLGGNNDLSDWGFLFKNKKGRMKWGKTHFNCKKRAEKRPLIQILFPGKIHVKNKSEIKTIFEEGKLREKIASRLDIKEMPKNSI